MPNAFVPVIAVTLTVFFTFAAGLAYAQWVTRPRAVEARKATRSPATAALTPHRAPIEASAS